MLNGTKTKSLLLASSGLILAFASTSAFAQSEPAATAADQAKDEPAPQTAAAPEAVGDIVVTGSRIATAGYKQPTPVTVIGEATLARDAKVTIGDSIRELPAVGISSSPSNGSGSATILSGLAGLDTINLRQLGLNRTLVLFDGQRVVQSTVSGGVDLGTMPQILVERVDVVTGGASAAWGSDAVAGVVNLVLNKKFDGLKLQAEYGNNYYGDRNTVHLSGAYGTSFAGNRGRVIVAANWFNSPDTIFGFQRPWDDETRLVPNSAYTPTNGQPRLIHKPNVGVYQATAGGTITGPATYTATVNGITATRPNPLLNMKFTGNGQLSPYTVDYVSGTAVSSGGDTDQIQAGEMPLVVPYRSLSTFGYASYEVTDSIKASVQFNWGTNWSRTPTNPTVRLAGSLNIPLDNPFIPAAARTALQGVGATSIQIATTNTNNISSRDQISMDALANTVGIPIGTIKRTMTRVVGALDGKIGSDWTWNAYYQRSEVKLNNRIQNGIILANYAFAVDAVDQGAYQNGVANGNIVCRATVPGKSTFNAAAAGCAPLNVFGTGVASQQAIDYVNTRSNYADTTLTQQTAAASIQGKLPFGLPAGNISVAFGGEYRTESAKVVADPGGLVRAYSTANFIPFAGKYNVKEGFVEAEVPVLENSIVDSLTLNAAARVTDYSTSGSVATWKVGGVSQINNFLRVRAVLSRDIRAPNLNELFSAGIPIQNVQVDPRTGANASIFTVTSGNPNLTPEKARTISAGFVLTPAPRLQMSLDYYSIKIDDAIYTVVPGQVLALCNAGDARFCNQLVFNGAVIASGPFAGQRGLSSINAFPVNVSTDETAGLDGQIDYSHKLFGGTLQYHLIGSYILKQRQTFPGSSFNYAGSIGPDSLVVGVPRGRMTGSLTYSQGPLSFTVQSRFIGAAKLNNAWGPKDVDDNHVPAIAYVDLRASYDLNDKFQVYGSIDNLFQKSPPNVAPSSAIGNGYYLAPTNGGIYDIIGGSFRVGVRAKF